MGRNIWQSENPVPMIKAVRSIVHGNNTIDQSYELFKKLCNETKNNKPKKPFKPNQNNKPKKPFKPNQNNKSKNQSNQNKK